MVADWEAELLRHNQVRSPRSPVPARSPYQPGDWVRVHGYGGHPNGPTRWGFRGFVTGSLGDTILTGVTDDGRGWAEYWGTLGPDQPNADPWPYCTCCPRRRLAPKPAQLGLF